MKPFMIHIRCKEKYYPWWGYPIKVAGMVYSFDNLSAYQGKQYCTSTETSKRESRMFIDHAEMYSKFCFSTQLEDSKDLFVGLIYSPKPWSLEIYSQKYVHSFLPNTMMIANFLPHPPPYLILPILPPPPQMFIVLPIRKFWTRLGKIRKTRGHLKTKNRNGIYFYKSELFLINLIIIFLPWEQPNFGKFWRIGDLVVRS